MLIISETARTTRTAHPTYKTARTTRTVHLTYKTARTTRTVHPTYKTCCSFLYKLFSTSSDLIFIELRSSSEQFLSNTEWRFLIPKFARIGQELWVTQSEIHLFAQRRATVTESFLTKFSISWHKVQSLIRGHRRTDGRSAIVST